MGSLNYQFVGWVVAKVTDENGKKIFPVPWHDTAADDTRTAIGLYQAMFKHHDDYKNAKRRVKNRVDVVRFYLRG